MERLPERVLIRWTWALLAVFVLLASGCGPIAHLRPGAERIVILRQRPPGQTALGRVWCRLGRNARSLQVNARGCRVHIRNDAYELGADLVVLHTEELGRYDCRNCVRMEGYAYTRRPGMRR